MLLIYTPTEKQILATPASKISKQEIYISMSNHTMTKFQSHNTRIQKMPYENSGAARILR